MEFILNSQTPVLDSFDTTPYTRAKMVSILNRNNRNDDDN